MANIDETKNRALEELERVIKLDELEALRVKYLGRKGELTNILRSIKDLPVSERKVVGAEANMARNELQEAIEFTKKQLKEQTEKLDIDVTRPGKETPLGHIHPLTRVYRDVRDIFVGMNFSVIDGPEIESEYYNFDALNIPEQHPSRDSWDTFWLKQTNGKKQAANNRSSAKSDRLLLRTHTSPVQIRYMEKHEPPFQIIVPGRVFRYEATDVSHETTFYQVEGLMVGEDVSLANLKFVIEKFFQEFFKGQKIDFRFRPGYFPFVEPGLEVDIKFGKGGWLEMLGAGMVHPRVFEAAHYNPRDYQGFAFGIGLDRLAMVKYKIPDVRLFHSGDLRFIRQF